MAATYERFDQSFELNDAGFLDEDTAWSGQITIVPSGTGGITSPDGSAHAIFTQTNGSGGLTGPFTRFDGYRNFGSGEAKDIKTTVKIYLDPGSMSAGEGFDYSVAANGTNGAHLRDFIFHVT